MKELPKAYLPTDYEKKIYQIWESSGYFNPDNLKSDGEPFSISLPPPNATGILHLGHAVMLAIQDLLIRFNRMLGKKTLWLPGTDHAAIATQNVVEKNLWEQEKKTRFDLGREKFINRVNDFVESSRNIIRNQMRGMGVSCDWSRERYTLDDGLSQTVKQVFVKMYHDGLIYRGTRIVNWCYRCGTTLADDEVEYKESLGKLYYINYGPVTVATTRPETKIGDTALAVNPKDVRYKKLIGQELEVVLGKVKVKVKVIADKIIDPNFGTGVVGVTPAHSLVDFELAQKYHLPLKEIIGPDGKMTTEAGAYVGLPVKEARQKLLADLGNKVEKIEDYKHNLSICYRCGTPVEPLPSKQWFVAVDKPFKIGLFKKTTLKKLAIEAVKSGQIKIIPERFVKVYFNWMENLHDWCISRQIWFGHRIPVWYRHKPEQSESDQEIYIGVKEPKGNDWQQDPDTLDTWFSSSLWTFSTLGWPKQTNDLKTFHPTSVIETGYDILFFWVARMILMTRYATKQIPFKTIYLHGMVRDKKGRKMSKSLSNGINPIEIIQKYGADTLRLSMIIGTTPGNDFRLYDEKIAGFRNFVNKLWNISRFILLTTKEITTIDKPHTKTLADKWVLSRLENITLEVTNHLNKFKFSQAAEKLYDFTWHELADWYLEIAKIEGDKNQILTFILQTILKLWHPFTPFITETIWQEAFKDKGLLMIQPWPKLSGYKNETAEKDLTEIQKIIALIRNFRAENKIAKDKILECHIQLTNTKIINEQKLILEGLRTNIKLTTTIKNKLGEIKDKDLSITLGLK